MSATEQSQAVKDATTLEEVGFPVNTPDGQMMATKSVDKDSGETIIEGENGMLEVTDDPHILAPAEEAKPKAAKASKSNS